MIAVNAHCAAEDELKKPSLLNEMDLSEIVSNVFTELTKSCISLSLTNVCSKINYIYIGRGKYIPWLRSCRMFGAKEQIV